MKIDVKLNIPTGMRGVIMDTRDLIIETAFISFIEDGFDRTSLNKIIKSTNLTKGAFYHYFKSKDELIIEVIKKYFFSFVNLTFDSISLDEMTFEEKLGFIFDSVLNFEITLSSRPEFEINILEFTSMINESMNRNQMFRELGHNQFIKMVDMMEVAVDIGKEKNEISIDLDSRTLAELINACVRGTIMTTSFFSIDDARDQLNRNKKMIIRLVSQ
jgi:AcrR family transcriptional regulator